MRVDVWNSIREGAELVPYRKGICYRYLECPSCARAGCSDGERKGFLEAHNLWARLSHSEERLNRAHSFYGQGHRQPHIFGSSARGAGRNARGVRGRVRPATPVGWLVRGGAGLGRDASLRVLPRIASRPEWGREGVAGNAKTVHW